MGPTETPASPSGDLTVERLSLGVAARLSRYLQVLTQARKMGKETISSHELSDYTHINSTQISNYRQPGFRSYGSAIAELGRHFLCRQMKCGVAV